MVTSTDVQHPVLHAPAPWNTKSECYWLFLTLKKLPEGVYDPLEASSEECVGSETGQFKGGLGFIMVVRYKDTPVGMCDLSLLFIYDSPMDRLLNFLVFYV